MFEMYFGLEIFVVIHYLLDAVQVEQKKQIILFTQLFEHYLLLNVLWVNKSLLNVFLKQLNVPKTCDIGRGNP